MTNAFGAIDLFAGSSAISGTDLFKIDKNPLNALSTDFANLPNLVTTFEEGVSNALSNIPELVSEALDFLVSIPLDIFEALIGIFGADGLGASHILGVLSTLSAIPLDFINAVLAPFGLGPLGVGSIGGTIGTTLGTAVGDVLRLPIDFINAVLNLFGLSTFDIGATTGTTGSNLGEDLIDALLGAFGLGSIPDLFTWLSNTESEASAAISSINTLISAVGGTVISDVANYLTTTLFNAANTAFTFVEDFLSGTGFPGDPGGLAGLINGLSTDVAIATSNWNTLLTTIGTDISGLGALINALAPSVVASLSALLADLGLPDVPSLAAFLTAIFPGFLPIIPASHIRNVNPELLLNPGFDSVTSITIGVGYTWDGSVGRTETGAAKASADGVTKFWMLSNPVPVAQGDEMAMSVWAQWGGVTTSGSSPAPIRLEVQPYGTAMFSDPAKPRGQGVLTGVAHATKFTLTGHPAGHGSLAGRAESQNTTTHVYNRYATLHGRGVLSATAVMSKSAAAGGTSGHGTLTATTKAVFGAYAETPTVLQAITSPSSSSTWVQLSGTYTVPAGVSTVYLQPVVDTTATGGHIWFDDASVKKAGGLAGGTGLIDTFETLLTNLFGSNNLLSLLIQDAVPALDQFWGKTIHGSLISTITGVEQSIVDNIANALGHAGTGHSVSDLITYLGAIPGSVISGITTVEQSIVDNIANALGHAGTGHTVANLFTYLGSIPGSVVTGITTIEQSIVDNIANALGHAGTGHTAADLFTYLGAIPGSVVSGITGVEQSIVDNIANALGHAGAGHTAADLFTYLGAIPGSVVTGITSTVSDDLQAIADFIYQAVNGGSSTGNALSTIFDTITGLLGGLASAITGQSILAATIDQAASVFAGQTVTLATLTAAVANLQSQQGQEGNTGLNFLVNFTGVADASSITSLGFTEVYSPGGYGTLGTASGRAALLPSGGNTFTGLAFCNTSTMTDYQVASSIYATAPGTSWTGNPSGVDILIVRANAAFTTYVYAAIGPNGCVLHNVVSGTDTVLDSASFSTNFNVGAIYSLVAGIAGNLYLYEIECNGTTLLSFNDGSRVTHVDSSHRYGGFGLQQNLGTAFTWTPSTVVTFGLVDNSPSSIVGSFARFYRQSTSTVSLGTSTINFPVTTALLGNSFYDEQAFCSNDITPALGTANKVSVSVPGIYVIKAGFGWAVSASANAKTLAGMALYKNGTLWEIGPALGPGPGSGSVTNFPISNVFIVPLLSGDYIQPAYYFVTSSSVSSTATGESTGTMAFLEVALANTGIAG